MTNYELTSLFTEMWMSAGYAFLNSVSIAVGFMFIGLFFGQLLNRTMTFSMIALYSIVFSGNIYQVYKGYDVFVAIAFQIKERAASGGGLEWLPITNVPDGVLHFQSSISAAMLAAVYVMSVIFFLHTHKLDPKQFR